MRKLIVSNFVTVDGFYEGKDKSINSLFDYFHEDYAGDNKFDYYNAELLRASDFLLLSRNSFLGNKEYWSGVLNNPKFTPIRQETAQLFKSIEKIVISDNLTSAELAPGKYTHHLTGRCIQRDCSAQTAAGQKYSGPLEPPALE